MVTAIEWINYLVCLLFIMCYAYQVFYIIIAIFRTPVIFKKTDERKRYAFMIAARNEEAVIGNLIDSINKQTYPKELIDIYVVADNCTDKTCIVAEKAGAVVYERFNDKLIGKGYALDFLFSQVNEMVGDEYYDGYFIFDADNLLDKRYVNEMNKALCAGHKVITSYRNSKNYASNWISSGFGLWFLRDSKHLNNPRMILGTSCCVAGTGFLISSEIIRRNKGWHFYMLTEDIEFSIDCILQDEKIAYCQAAKYYDEQPTKFKTAWNQRIRWVKGYLQVFKKYRKQLFRGYFGTNAFSCFDMTMTIMPAIVLSIVTVVANIITLVLSLLVGIPIWGIIKAGLITIAYSTGLMWFLALCVTLTEWKEIKCSAGKKMLYVFTFPLYTFTYIPIAIAALFMKPQWKPIKHDDDTSIEELGKKKKKPPKTKKSKRH